MTNASSDSATQIFALNDMPCFPFPPRGKEVPVEERNGDAHEEAEQAADEEEGGGEGEEVVEEEAAPAEEEEEEDQAVEETDEVTDDTVNAARPEPPAPPSIPGMLCLPRPFVFPSFLECSVFPSPKRLRSVFFPSLLTRPSSPHHFSSCRPHLALTCVESLWIEFRVLPKTSVLPSCAVSRDVERPSLFRACDVLVSMVFPFSNCVLSHALTHMPHPPRHPPQFTVNRPIESYADDTPALASASLAISHSEISARRPT